MPRYWKMKTIACCALLLIASKSMLAADAPTASKALQGIWLPVEAELGGNAMPDEALKAITLKLGNGVYEVTVVGEPKGHTTVDKGQCTIDETTTPKSLDIKGTDGPNNGKTFPCIFELEGATLRVCYDLSGKKRPTEFKSPSGTAIYLVTYKRKAADEQKK
jgi:uncharacterized protein (TIGR03067 family)